jgi:hypothetical protein
MNQVEKSKVVRAWMAANQGKHFCGCGCGGVIEIKIQHSSRGIPRFINGHTSRVNHPMRGRFGDKNPNYSGGRHVNNAGYIKVLVPGPGRSRYVLEHRLVMERYLGRKLTADEDVHHRNRIKADNRIENLELRSHSNHAEEHARLGEAGFALLFATKGVPWTGSKHPAAKVTEEDVREIRQAASAGEDFGSLGERFGLTATAVRFICRRKTWKHVS